MNRHIQQLPIIAFTTGFTLMVFELAAARLLAPVLGSSIYVWTSVIGIVIAALSAGVWVGGKLADNRNHKPDISWMLLLCSFAVCLMLITSDSVLGWLGTADMDQRVKGMVASLLLFAPTGFIIGAIGPYLAKFNVTSLDKTGQSIANLDAMNALGGIAGTFLAGFVLFAVVGTRGIFFILSILLITLSWSVAPHVNAKKRLITSISLLVIAALTTASVYVSSNTIATIDTATAHYSVSEGVLSNQRVRLLVTGPSAGQSGINLDKPSELLFWYTQELANVIATLPNAPQNILVLGGGAFTLPAQLAQQYPNSKIDTVEIDPELTAIAKTYFNFTEQPNLAIINEDARTYLRTTTKQYDVIMVDVYSDFNVPFTLMTQEYGRDIKAKLSQKGVVLVNVIGGNTGACGQLTQNTLAPYQQQFDQSYIKRNPSSLTTPAANHIAYFSDTVPPAALQRADYAPQGDFKNAAYKDDYAPIEAAQYACAQL